MKSKLNSSMMGLLITIVLLGGTVACTSTPTRESTGQYLDDSTITTKVKAKFVDDPLVSGLRISVETYKGVVQLSGFANSRAEINQAGELARQTDGVRSVKNDIHLKK
jgi:hyperosmotically inducible periplasmic protein